MPFPKIEDIGGLTKQIETVTETIHNTLFYPLLKQHIGGKGTAGIIIYGQHGSGKTMLARAVCEKFRSQPCGTCKPL